MSETLLFRLKRANEGRLILPATPMDQETLDEIPDMREGKAEITFPRSLPFHKKFFALLKVGYDYMDEATRARYNIHSTAQLLIMLKLDLGLYTLHIAGGGGMLPEGQPIYIPDSISFARMDEVKFAKFYKSVIGVLIGKYTTNQNENSMMQAVNAVLRFE